MNLLLESGGQLLLESGGRLLIDGTLTTGQLLLESGGQLLLESGGRLLVEGTESEAPTLGQLLLESGGRLLTEDGGRLLLEGVTPPTPPAPPAYEPYLIPIQFTRRHYLLESSTVDESQSADMVTAMVVRSARVKSAVRSSGRVAKASRRAAGMATANANSFDGCRVALVRCGRVPATISHTPGDGSVAFGRLVRKASVPAWRGASYSRTGAAVPMRSIKSARAACLTISTDACEADLIKGFSDAELAAMLHVSMEMLL